MSVIQDAQSHTLFPDLPNRPSCRTYSRKGQSRRAEPLPALRANAPPKRRDTRQTARLESQVSHKDPEDNAVLLLQHEGAEQPTNDHYERRAHSVGPQDDFPNTEDAFGLDEYQFLKGEGSQGGPIAYAWAEGSEDLANAYETDGNGEDSDGDAISSSTPPSPIVSGPNQTQTRSTSYRPRSIRRRPFLICNNIKPRGYKKLKPKADSDKAQVLQKSRLGDGFSDHEVRPDRLFHITRKKKLPLPAAQGFGALDLAQSTPTEAVRQKRKIRRAEDNSFAPSKIGVGSTGVKRQKTVSAGPKLARNAGIDLPVAQTNLFPSRLTSLPSTAGIDTATEELGKEQEGAAPVTNTERVLEPTDIILPDAFNGHTLVPSILPASFQLPESPESGWKTYIPETSPVRATSNLGPPRPLTRRRTTDAAAQTTPQLFRRTQTI